MLAEAKLERRGRPTGDLLLVIGVIVVLVVAAALLNTVASRARSINGHAADIAASTSGIDEDTSAIRLLDRTNELAASILNSSQPLEGQLADTIGLVEGVDGTVRSINDSARSINQSAKDINGAAASIETDARDILATAQGIDGTVDGINAGAASINQQAAAILDVAARINDDVRLINENLNDTIEVVGTIRGDTQDIVAEARRAHQLAACIDREVNVTATVRDGALGVVEELLGRGDALGQLDRHCVDENGR